MSDRPADLPAVQDVTACRFGPRDPRLLEIERRQALAGEEDQTVPGWDFGA